VNYGTSKQVADLPLTRLGYGGSEADAAWRKAAEARIENIRKGNLTVVVKDTAGKPVRAAEVSVRMRKHAFHFGTAVNGVALAGKRESAENLERYKQEIVRLFNFSVMENATKWPQWSVVESGHAGGGGLAARKRIAGTGPQPCVALLAQHEREGGAGCQG
jgi:endo-1,4-beta-xylanase